jgi:UDP-glucose 4-epimerase
MRRYLITGYSGFIGQHLLNALADEAVFIRGLSRGKGIDITYLPIETVHGDLTEPDSIKAVTSGIDTIFHAAGHAHSLNTAVAVHQKTTVEGTRNLLAEAEKHGVGRFIFISSVKAMPDPGNDCIDEYETGLPADPYGLSRREAEDLVLETGRRTGMHVCILRPALVYGPGCKGNLLNLIKRIDRGWFPPIPDNGNIRSMVDVHDLVSAILLAAERPAANGGVFIITDGEAYSTHRIYSAFLDAMGRTVPRWSLPAQVLRILGKAGDAWEGLLKRPAPFNSQMCSRLLDSACYHSDLARQVLEFRPEYRFEDSVAEMLAAYRESRK